jgi:hypothetical protein
MPKSQNPVVGGGADDSLGPMPPVGNTDPGGGAALQAGSTASSTGGLLLVATSHPGGTVDTLLRLGTHPMEVMTAGLSMATIGHVSLLTAGLVLIGLGIVLNIMSMVVRWQNRYAVADACEREVEWRARRYAQSLRLSAKQDQPQVSTGNPNRPNE